MVMKMKSMRKTISEEKEKLDCLLTEGYKAQKTIDKKINDEWEDITLENWDN